MPRGYKGLTRADYESALRRTHGDRAAAARSLGVSPSTVREWAERHGLEVRNARLARDYPLRSCERCKTTIPSRDRKRSEYERVRYCSPRCADEGRRGRRGGRAPNGGTVAAECTTCGAEVVRYASRLGAVVFCSRACRRRREQVPCAICGASLERPACKVRQGGAFACAGPCWRTLMARYAARPE